MEPELGERLVECHRRVGPLSQYRDFVAIDQFDVRDRIHTLEPPLLLIRGVDDPAKTPEYELKIHQAVAGSQYVKLNGCGHFPFAERPAEVNRAIDASLAPDVRNGGNQPKGSNFLLTAQEIATGNRVR